ncbi:Guanine deaminase [Acipenser ruthenus]|uniref:Guanine deaminase n=1 Tax=Acipenser ruthenus TaxID=7906 RepID=A0A444TXG7_ACIRT|nr:Guanine deaminase [Acipenser ruthenus]
MVDTHIHASQYSYMGTGLDMPLLQWLNTYTFPAELKYNKTEFAEEVYNKVVKRTLKNGTTTACYFATIHTDSTLLLGEIADKIGQRALVGKVCMDINNTVEEYKETTEESSHISENTEEVQIVKEMFPDCKSYTDVYNKYNLLTNKTVMAHGCHLTDKELDIFNQRGAAISHCPNSNLSLCSGLLDVRNVLKHKVKIGLGTDVSGGYSPSMLDAMRRALDTSKALTIQTSGYETLTYKEVFRLATLGGSQALALEDTIGNFEVGKDFDAVLVSPSIPGGPFDVFAGDTFEVMYFSSLFPYVVLICFLVRALLLKGSVDGISHMFTPKLEIMLEPKVWREAATQVFFALGLGFGGVIAFSSYNKRDNNCHFDAVLVSFINFFTSVLATLVVFAVLGFKANIMNEKCVAL